MDFEQEALCRRISLAANNPFLSGRKDSWPGVAETYMWREL